MRSVFQLKHLILALAFGAVLTVATSWLIAILVQTGWIQSWNTAVIFDDAAAGRSTLVAEGLAFGYQHLIAHEASDVGGGSAPKTVTTAPSGMPRDIGANELWQCSRFGWPLLALQWQARTSLATSPITAPNLAPAINLEWGSSRYALPLGPRPVGFLANTVVYGVLVLAARAGVARLLARRHVGKCPKCRYLLEGLAPRAPCPECGNPTASTPV